jgi:hypothetical protein
MGGCLRPQPITYFKFMDHLLKNFEKVMFSTKTEMFVDYSINGQAEQALFANFFMYLCWEQAGNRPDFL